LAARVLARCRQHCSPREGSCTLNGDDLDVVTFSTSANEDNWIKVGGQFGWIKVGGQFGGVIVKGALWVIAAGSQASADAVTAKLGGTIAT